MKRCLSKKGFTLVELLAVIVILALIMGIAVFSVSGVLDNARNSTAKRTAGSYIDGVRKSLLFNNNLETGAYFFDSTLMESGGIESPWGGSFTLAGGVITSSITSAGSSYTVEKITNGIYRVSGAAPTCSATATSFITITESSGVYTYSICLTSGAGNHYIEGTEAQILDESNLAIIK